MAGSLANTKLVVTALVDGISLSINRTQGITSVATHAVESSVVRVETVKKPSSSTVTEVFSWVPDPVTGFYKPENHADVAELRDTLLNQKI